MMIEFAGHTPELASDVFVAPNATLVGNVHIGAGSCVMFGAVVRADDSSITIGSGSNVQDNATLHAESDAPLTIGDNVTIGHNAVVHCAVVGDNSVIGMGAEALNGAVIGKNCVIGAGAVVKEYAVVPDGTLMVGVPAKAVRELSSEAIEQLQKPNLYVTLAQEYLQCLK